MKYVTILVFLSLSFFGFSQGEASHWYFGNGAGLIFDTSTRYRDGLQMLQPPQLTQTKAVLPLLILTAIYYFIQMVGMYGIKTIS